MKELAARWLQLAHDDDPAVELLRFLMERIEDLTYVVSQLEERR